MLIIYRMLREDELDDVPLLVLANKQDLLTARSIETIIEQLDLHSMRRYWCKYYYV